MTIRRIFPAEAPARFTFTSKVLQAIDADHVNALDKTGDTTAGDIAIATGYRLQVASGGLIEVQSGGEIDCDSGSINNIFGTENIGDGANPATFRVHANSTFQLDTSSTVTNSAVFQINTFGTFFQSAGGGRFQLADAAGGGDYFVFETGHTAKNPKRRYDLQSSFSNFAGYTGWGTFFIDFGVKGPGTTQAARIAIPVGPAIWNGGTISALKLIFTPAGSTGRGGLLPGSNIAATLKYYTPNFGGTALLGTLGSTGTYSPVSFADYTNGLPKSLTIPCGAHLIDTSANCYVLEVTDEHGANAIAGNIFHALEITYTLDDNRPS
jgi:hypothetical protein